MWGHNKKWHTSIRQGERQSNLSQQRIDLPNETGGKVPTEVGLRALSQKHLWDDTGASELKEGACGSETQNGAKLSIQQCRHSA